MQQAIDFQPMTPDNIPLYLEWAKIPHVKEVWFIGDYEAPEKIQEKIDGNGYDYPNLILLDGKPIGYLVYCDLYAYKTLCNEPSGAFTDETEGTYCMDLFIADPDLLGQGLGTQIVTQFSDWLLRERGAKKVLIDPSASNKQAIRCYEKSGFKPLRTAHDGTSEVLILEKS